MDKVELDAIREKVASEPEGSLARTLLAEIDRLNQANEDRAVSEIRQHFRKEGLTEAEVDKVMILALNGKFPEREEGPCRHCDGTGFTDEAGCIGVRVKRCDQCHGRGKGMRTKVPNDEEVLAAAMARTPKTNS